MGFLFVKRRIVDEMRCRGEQSRIPSPPHRAHSSGYPPGRRPFVHGTRDSTTGKVPSVQYTVLWAEFAIAVQ